ncbi:hypothetical protein C5167_017967 [Papaver somniferum]|uniref:Uncharacterized protein n=1 Tax=Papaver somniferum TaxID=3469 RepID=A0A4Y7IN47_PAPSO|nr:hypothetical protein C5167_017967 [Papaver somniferum]
MLWLWDWVVFVFAWICISINVVLCYNSVLWKLLSQGPKGTGRPCCLCYCCVGIFNCIVDYDTCSFALNRM